MHATRQPTVPLLGYCFEAAHAPCLVFPLCLGGTLEDRLMPHSAAARKRLSALGWAVPPAPLAWRVRLAALRDAARALAHLHAQRLLHGDVKPSNILLAVNPYERLPIYDEKAMAAFPNNVLSKNDPHVFATSEEAYQRIKKDRRSQSIVVSGESGAGKTETNKCRHAPTSATPIDRGWPAGRSLLR